MDSGIYFLGFAGSHNFYIGSTVNFKRRWREHKSRLASWKHRNAHLQNAFNKYGEENLVFGIVEEVDKDRLLEREKYHIESHLTHRLYNVAIEVGRPDNGAYWKGRKRGPMSEDMKKKLSIAHMGHKDSDETKRKKSIAAKGRTTWNKGIKIPSKLKDKMQTKRLETLRLKKELSSQNILNPADVLARADSWR